jgi:hypothetical protein
MTLIALSAEHKVKNNIPTNEQIEAIKRSMSGFYDLTDREIRSIDDFISESEAAQKIVGEAASVIDYLDTEEQKEYVQYVSKLIFNLMPDSDLKKKIKPEVIYETVMNLGVITMYRTSSQAPDENKPPIQLLKHLPNIAENVIERYLGKEIEKMPVSERSDFEKVKTKARELYEALINYARE